MKAGQVCGGRTAVFRWREEMEKADTRRWLFPSYGENFPQIGESVRRGRSRPSAGRVGGRGWREVVLSIYL